MQKDLFWKLQNMENTIEAIDAKLDRILHYLRKRESEREDEEADKIRLELERQAGQFEDEEELTDAPDFIEEPKKQGRVTLADILQKAKNKEK